MFDDGSDWRRRMTADCLITPSRLIGLDAFGGIFTFKRPTIEKTRGPPLILSFSLCTQTITTTTTN